MPSRRLIKTHCLRGLVPFFLTVAWGNLGLYHDPNRATGPSSIPIKMSTTGWSQFRFCLYLFSSLFPRSPRSLFDPPAYTLYIFPLISSSKVTFFTMDSEFLVQKYRSRNISSFEQFNSIPLPFIYKSPICSSPPNDLRILPPYLTPVPSILLGGSYLTGSETSSPLAKKKKKPPQAIISSIPTPTTLFSHQSDSSPAKQAVSIKLYPCTHASTIPGLLYREINDQHTNTKVI